MLSKITVFCGISLTFGLGCSDGASTAEGTSDPTGSSADGGDNANSPTSSGGSASGGAAANGGVGIDVSFGGETASGGAGASSSTGGAATGGQDGDPAPVCDPSGDTKMVLNNDSPSTFQSTGFEDGGVNPFVVCTTQSPNYGRGSEFMGRNVLEFHWKEESYNGSRMTKGAEICGGPRFHKEGWYGFQFYLPDPGFPKDKTQGIAQIFGLGGCSSWVSKLRVDDNKLVFSRRHYCGEAVDTVIAEDIERNKWHSVVIHFIVSQAEEGLTEVWFGDDVCNQANPTYRATDINYGFGDWDTETDSIVRSPIDPASQGGFREVDTNEIEFKLGMYTFDNVNYTEGETRTLYYDNVSMLAEVGEEGWAIVNPAF